MSGYTRRDFKDEDHYQFYSCLSDAERYGSRLSDTFETFLFLSQAAMKQAVNRLLGKWDQELEDKVLRVQENARDWKKYSEALSILGGSLEKKPSDFLGTFAGSCSALNTYMGQFFTPYHLCELMAQMTFGNEFLKPDSNHRITISEPAVGAGAMIIASTNILKKRGFQPWNYFVECWDLSQTAYRMAYIQLNLLGVPAMIVNGNTLSLEVFDTTPTITLAMFPYRKQSEAKDVDISKVRDRSRVKPVARVRERKRPNK